MPCRRHRTRTIIRVYLDAETKRAIIDETAGESMRTDADETLAWIRESVAPDKVAQTLGKAVRSWAQADFNAVGIWLGKLPDSPDKDTAICTFAETVVELDPLAAATWAAEISDESSRNSTLRSTLDHWDRIDADAAKAWADSQGIDPELHTGEGARSRPTED